MFKYNIERKFIWEEENLKIKKQKMGYGYRRLDKNMSGSNFRYIFASIPYRMNFDLQFQILLKFSLWHQSIILFSILARSS